MDYRIIEGRNYKSPATKFSKSDIEVKLVKICTGFVVVTKKGMQKTNEKITEDLPVYAYMFFHPKHGYYLIDAGLEKMFQSKKYGTQKGIARNFIANRAYQQKGQSVSEYIESKGIELSGVFLSHLHFDHIGGMIDLDFVDEVIVGKGEVYNKYKPFYYGYQLKHVQRINELDFDGCNELYSLGQAIDYFEDGSLIIFSTPGHTNGHLSFLVNSKEKTYFIACDAYGYKREGLIQNGPGYYSENFDAARNTLVKILDFAKKHPNVEIIAGHGE